MNYPLYVTHSINVTKNKKKAELEYFYSMSRLFLFEKQLLVIERSILAVFLGKFVLVLI
jgi:hypothetical protein